MWNYSFAAAQATAKVPFQWSPAMDQAFQTLNLSSALHPSSPDPELQFVLEVPALQIAWTSSS